MAVVYVELRVTVDGNFTSWQDVEERVHRALVKEFDGELSMGVDVETTAHAGDEERTKTT